MKITVSFKDQNVEPKVWEAPLLGYKTFKHFFTIYCMNDDATEEFEVELISYDIIMSIKLEYDEFKLPE